MIFAAMNSIMMLSAVVMIVSSKERARKSVSARFSTAAIPANRNMAEAFLCPTMENIAAIIEKTAAAKTKTANRIAARFQPPVIENTIIIPGTNKPSATKPKTNPQNFFIMHLPYLF